jgi:hypothetical protein
MIRALKSSWWLHIPGMLAIAAMVALMAARRPWPSRAPVHFDFYWNADRWGSPWESSIFPVLAIGILLAAIWSSTVWATREDGLKRFNLTLPLVVAPLGGMMGVHFWYWWNLPQLAGAGFSKQKSRAQGIQFTNADGLPAHHRSSPADRNRLRHPRRPFAGQRGDAVTST